MEQLKTYEFQLIEPPVLVAVGNIMYIQITFLFSSYIINTLLSYFLIHLF
jgi:hypothetical protein